MPRPEVSFTRTSRCDPPPLQLQLSLEHVAQLTSSIIAPHRHYSDGSLQLDEIAGRAVCWPDLSRLLVFEWTVGFVTTPALLCVSFCLICQKGVNVDVVCGSKPALRSLSVVKPLNLLIVRQIFPFITLVGARGLCVKFIWIRFHVILRHHIIADRRADRLAKETCRQPRRDDGRPLSLQCYLYRVRSAVLLPVQYCRDA